MKKIDLFQIDAFAEKPFTGNPAAVLIIDEWLDDITMQNIAMENNLSETAFVVRDKSIFHIRFFTPNSEVELCGHATLASAFVLFNFFDQKGKEITFRTQRKGDLFINMKEDIIEMNFPTDVYKEVLFSIDAFAAFKLSPIEAYRGNNDLMLVFENEKQIAKLKPNFEILKKLNARGVIITAKGNEVDFVSRYFAPNFGIYEDPVTGSAHTTLIPYWHKKLGKETLIAKQLSKRGGTIYCEYKGNRVKIGGKAIHFLTGTINI